MLLPKKKSINGSIPTLSSVIENFFSSNDDFFSSWPTTQKLPAVNVKETENSYAVEVAAPGMKKENFMIEVDQGALCISGESKSENEESDDNYSRKEFNYTSFSRSFWLPENVKEEDIQAKYNDGVLKLAIPKKEVKAAEPKKKIEVA